MDRIRQQKDRLVGLNFTPQNEPSHSLIDRDCQQLEDNVVTYIELNRCSSRHDEALHSKVDTSLALDSSGVCGLVKKQRLDDVNVAGEHKLRQAFLRRSLAYDLAGIAIFSVLDLWTKKLFEKMNEAPLANRLISVEQVINADKALWVKVSNDTRGKLQPKTGDDKPFDVSFTKFCEHPEVLQHLTPLQSIAGQRHENVQTSSSGGKGKVAATPMAKARDPKAKEKQVQALLSRTIARSLWMANSLANVGRLAGAQPRSNQAKGAWYVITFAGRSRVISFTRAMSAHTDLQWTDVMTVSLWKLQPLKFVVAQQVCQAP